MKKGWIQILTPLIFPLLIAASKKETTDYAPNSFFIVIIIAVILHSFVMSGRNSKLRRKFPKLIPFLDRLAAPAIFPQGKSLKILLTIQVFTFISLLALIAIIYFLQAKFYIIMLCISAGSFFLASCGLALDGSRYTTPAKNDSPSTRFLKKTFDLSSGMAFIVGIDAGILCVLFSILSCFTKS